MLIGVAIFIIGVFLGAWSQSRWCKGHKDNAAAWASAQGNWYAHRITLEKDNSDLSERLYIATHTAPQTALEKKKMDKRKKK